MDAAICWPARWCASPRTSSPLARPIGRRLAEMELKPWQKKMWCIPKVDAEFVARMEDVLDLYAEPPDPKRPVVCFDETPRQLIGEARVPIPARSPASSPAVDYEYVRNGTANVFMFVDVNRPWRHAKVTDQRTLRRLRRVHARPRRRALPRRRADPRRAGQSLGALAAALYQAFEPAEARRILRRLEFHFTPKHASWLNMVEIEIGVMVRAVPRPPHPREGDAAAEIAAWEARRNAGGRINWMFTVDRAREKLGRCIRRRATRASRRRRERVKTTATEY